LDFRLDDEQVALGDTIAAFCAARAPLERIAERESAPDAALWQGLAELGLFGLFVPESEGGSGATTVDAAVALEHLGATLVPGPLVWSCIGAPLAPGAIDGSVRVAGIVAGDTTGPVIVDHGNECDVVLIVRPDRVESCPTANLTFSEAHAFDPLTSAATLEQLPTGAVVGDTAAASTLRRRGTALTAAQLVGLAQGALTVARDYSLQRHQFGVPIGSFQAIKHILADMYVRVELARNAAHAAAAILDDARAGDADTAASTAKLLAGDAAVTNSRMAVQVLGGMGFTWEMLPHYFLKRAWVLETNFGASDTHAVSLSRVLESDVASSAAAWT
jgi:alkylation response protein AidB-like acyl-CoA dehydrogenase